MGKAPMFACFCVLVAAVGCGGSDAPPPNDTPYTSDPNKTTVIGGAGGTYTTPQGNDCITLASGECVKPQTECKQGERADVIVDSKGKVVEIVCYPASATPTPVDSSGNVELGKENKGVVSIDGAVDGIDVAGNVDSSGNNVVVYGQGADVSVIGGNVDADGNNFSMRGVTVKKTVTISGNNATLVLCVIEGDVIVKGNNTVIADCSIKGKVKIEGNNTILVGNEIGGGIDLTDTKNTVCDGNVAWNDANANGVLDPGETGAALTCN